MASASKKVIYAALIGNGLIAITKFFAAAVTGSSAMLAEGVHSVVDTGNQVLLLHGLRQGEKPADDKFPFGYGKEVYFWSFVVAILIFALGAGISIYEGIKHIRHPNVIESPHISYIVLAIAFVFESAAWTVAFREFRRSKGNSTYLKAVSRGKDPSTFVVLFEDTAAGIGLVVAFVGILLAQITGNPVYDGIASVVIGLILALTAMWLSYETKGLLIGEAANRPVVEGIRKLALELDAILAVNEVRTMHVGPQTILVALSVDFRDELVIGQVEQAIANLDRLIKSEFPNVQYVYVEAESRHFISSQLMSES